MGMKRQNLMGMLAFAMVASQQSNFINEPEIIIHREPKLIIPKNHKEFFYGLNSVFALNQKNADKKAKAKGYL